MKKTLTSSAMIFIIAGLVILDQVSKYYIKTSMYLGQSYPVIGDFFRITFVENPGMAFGVRIGNPVIFMGLSIAAAVLVFIYLFRLRNEGWPLQLALCFITAGAIGNLADRFIYGKVVDFLDFEFFDVFISPFTVFNIQFSGYSMTRWPVFNVADMAVSGGMIILIAYLIFVGDPTKKESHTPAETSNG